jgi:prolipoprotein diacylglyceryl transferase
MGIFLALYLYSRKKPGQEYLWLLDRIAIVAVLGGFFIRLGNLFNSEIVGKPATVAWAIIFTRIDIIPRHPTQLYEAFAYLIIFIMLIKIYLIKRDKTSPGFLLGMFLVNVFTFRFFVEFLKENQSNFESNMPINMGQLLSIPLIIAGIVFLARVKLHRNFLF